MHLDAVWAAQNGQYGGAIAYGFLTVSLLTTLFNSEVGDPTARERHAEGSYLNYGLDRVRLVAPVPAGASVRGHFSVADRRQDAQDRQFQAFDNNLLDRTVIRDTDLNGHGTVSNDLADALVEANPNRFQEVPPSEYVKGIDY